jgi:Domain of unknown function (DUF1992)
MASQIEKLIDEWLAQKPEQDLPGKGKPLDLNEYFGWPEERRMAYSLLKNAGCVPFEVELLQEIASLQDSIERCTDSKKLHKLQQEFQARQVELNLRLEERRSRPDRRR